MGSLGMTASQAGFLVYDPLRKRVLFRDDDHFFHKILAYSQLMFNSKGQPTYQPETAELFSLFPTGEEESSAIPIAPSESVAFPQPSYFNPIDAIQLSRL